MKKKIVVYLAELIHSEFGLSLLTVPLGIGVVGSYCKHILKKDVEIRLFRKINDLIVAVKEKTPDIVGFAYFSWNDSLSLVASKIIRQLCPETVIVFGGSSIINGLEDSILKPGADREALESQHNVSLTPYNNLQFLSDNPEIDFIIYGDGEVPFTNIVTKVLSGCGKESLMQESVDGCVSLIDGLVVRGKPSKIIYDLDVTPSPYTTGLFTDFLEQLQLIPQIETVRGCPFTCAFCTIGGLPPHLRKHSLGFIKEEILYLKEHSSHRILRISDPNWGIIEQDIQVAEFIRKLHDTTGYPSSLRVYYSAKGPIHNIKIMAKLMKDLLPLNMSFQTLNKDSLINIRRSNFPLEKIKEMCEFGHAQGLSTSTELISGLPGETYESFREGFLTAIRLGIDSIYINPLYLIKGSELDTNEKRTQYGFKTAFTLIGKDVTRVNDWYIFEKDEMVIQSKSMSEKDFWELHKFRLFSQLSYGAAFFKEIIMHCLNYGITPLDLFDELLGNANEYSFFNKITTQYIEDIRSVHFNTVSDLERKIKNHLAEGKDIGLLDASRRLRCAIGKVLGVKEKQSFCDEIVKAAMNLYEKKNDLKGRKEEFLKILNILAELTPLLIISPCEDGLKKEVCFTCDYDLLAWARDNYEIALLKYYRPKPFRFVLVVRNIDEHKDILKLIKSKNWDSEEMFDFYFTTVVSSNLRRSILCFQSKRLKKENVSCDLAKSIT